MRKHSPGPDHSEPLSPQSEKSKMTNSKNSTNPGRRAFLGASAAFTVSRLTGPVAAFQPDPVFAAIEAHRAAVAATVAAVDLYSDLDEELPIEKSRSRITAWEETIVETDDPRWIDAERGVMKAHNNETDAACVLVSEPPTTIVGVLALLQYAIAADTDGECWPQLESDDGKRSRSWQYFLIEMLSDALPGMVGT
jgi:hypothetical protein